MINTCMNLKSQVPLCFYRLTVADSGNLLFADTCLKQIRIEFFKKSVDECGILLTLKITYYIDLKKKHETHIKKGGNVTL